MVVHEWAPPQRAAGKPVILFVHGIGMHGEPYAAIAAGFTSRGVTFIAPDLRGHGRSQGKRGILAQARVMRSDLDTVLALVEKRHPAAPVILMGDSMGALIAADYARRGQKRLTGLILLTPAFQVHPSRLCVPPEIKELSMTGHISIGKAGPFGAVTTASLGIGIDARVSIDTAEHLGAGTRVPGFIRAKQRDPLALHEVNMTYLLRLAQTGAEWPEAASELKLPLIMCMAGEDRIIDAETAKRVFDRAGTSKGQKTWKKWDNACHTLCWDPVTPELIDYLAEWATQQRK